MTATLFLSAVALLGVAAGWLARSHRAHVLARRRRLAETLRRSHPSGRRALIARIDLGMWDADLEACLPADLKRRSTA